MPPEGGGTARRCILVLGGFGVFGGRLVERLAATTGLEVIVAGRNAAPAEAFVEAV